jgi:hypothetical protein
VAFRKRTSQEEGARARSVLDRAVLALREAERNGTGTVAVADMLRILGAYPEPVPVPQAPRDPGADPLTGARWAGPPGSAPPEPR